MGNSASSLRERRAAATSLGLQTEARRLTAERGLSGFTIEELCSEVGVSRRTFFNYFASKENAVLGIPVHSDTTDLEDAFVAGTGALVDDFAELHIAKWERLDLKSTDAEALGRAFDREPRLFAHFVSLAAEGEQHDIALVRRRPDAPDDDLRTEAVVRVFSAVVRPAIFAYFADDSQDFRTLLLSRLDAARSVFSL
ncbi:TetR/AcrR family transcriptional regulator [Microbacterium sp. cf046]|uniref:TetR/AcrR family transcriptional regulator n=1 Tax=Microbacterium sp. cf046 TaxID=1761803 RepID=UPI000B873FFB|nr:TetR/AcrR family transcriptional regulator [Microbacterium sp. cf046]